MIIMTMFVFILCLLIIFILELLSLDRYANYRIHNNIVFSGEVAISLFIFFLIECGMLGVDLGILMIVLNKLMLWFYCDALTYK